MPYLHRTSMERTKIGFFVEQRRLVQSGTQPRGSAPTLERLQEIVDVPIWVLMSPAGGAEPCADEDVGAPRVLVPRGRG